MNEEQINKHLSLWKQCEHALLMLLWKQEVRIKTQLLYVDVIEIWRNPLWQISIPTPVNRLCCKQLHIIYSLINNSCITNLVMLDGWNSDKVPRHVKNCHLIYIKLYIIMNDDQIINNLLISIWSFCAFKLVSTSRFCPLSKRD